MAAVLPKEEFLSFSEVSHEADYYDDWLFGSTKRYQLANMYETDKCIQAAHWHGIDNQYILLGTNEMLNNEILVYKLPEIDEDGDTDTLSKDREISILAATPCARPCHNIVSPPKSFKNRNIFARTEFGSSEIFLHSTPEVLNDSTIAVLPQLDSFNLDKDEKVPQAINLVGNSMLVCSNCLGNLLWYDISAKMEVVSSHHDTCSSSDPTSNILAIEDDILAVCGSRTGAIVVTDKRTPTLCTAVAKPSPDRSMFWSFCNKDNQLILVNNNNQLYTYDVRYPLVTKLHTSLGSSPWTGRKGTSNLACHIYENWLSISGKDNKIRIYDMSKLSEDASAEPTFTHDGHLPDIQGGDMPTVTSHSWNTFGKPRLLSTSDTGQLHTWMFATNSS